MSTTPAAAKRTVLVSGLTGLSVVSVAWVADPAHRGPNALVPPRIVLGAFLVMIALSAIADPLPGMASGLAVLILVSTIAASGPPVFQAIQRLTREVQQ